MGLPRFDVWVSPGAARRRNHFLVMTSLWVGDFRINALIAHRRWRDYALVLGRWRGLLFLVGSGWVFALRNGLVPRFAHVGTRRGIGGTCEQDQHRSYRRIAPLVAKAVLAIALYKVPNSKHWFRHAVASGSTSVANLCSHLCQACIPRRILHGRHAQQFYARLELPLASRRLTIPKHSTVTMPCFAAGTSVALPTKYTAPAVCR